MRRIATLLCGLALCCSAMVTPIIVSITADGAAHQIATTGGASWIQFVAPSSNTGTAYVGPAGITSSTGQPLVAGSGQFWPPLPADTRDNQLDRRYNLAGAYYICQTGDKLYITYVP